MAQEQGWPGWSGTGTGIRWPGWSGIGTGVRWPGWSGIGTGVRWPGWSGIGTGVGSVHQYYCSSAPVQLIRSGRYVVRSGVYVCPSAAGMW